MSWRRWSVDPDIHLAHRPATLIRNPLAVREFLLPTRIVPDDVGPGQGVGRLELREDRNSAQALRLATAFPEPIATTCPDCQCRQDHAGRSDPGTEVEGPDQTCGMTVDTLGHSVTELIVIDWPLRRLNLLNKGRKRLPNLSRNFRQGLQHRRKCVARKNARLAGGNPYPRCQIALGI